MATAKGVIFKGRPYIVEDEWPSPLQRDVMMYRLRKLGRNGKPGKTVITVRGNWRPKPGKVKPHSGSSGNGTGTLE